MLTTSSGEPDIRVFLTRYYNQVVKSSDQVDEPTSQHQFQTNQRKKAPDDLIVHLNAFVRALPSVNTNHLFFFKYLFKINEDKSASSYKSAEPAEPEQSSLQSQRKFLNKTAPLIMEEFKPETVEVGVQTDRVEPEPANPPAITHRNSDP